jgi:hypothetical protein
MLACFCFVPGQCRPVGWRDEDRKAAEIRNPACSGTTTTSPTPVAANSSSSNNNTSHYILNSNKYHGVVNMPKKDSAEHRGSVDVGDKCLLINNNSDNGKPVEDDNNNKDVTSNKNQVVVYMPVAHPMQNVIEYAWGCAKINKLAVQRDSLLLTANNNHSLFGLGEQDQ